MSTPSSDVQKIRCYLKNQLINNTQFIGHDREKKQIFDLLKRTITHGESNSALLIGPRGAGKTTLVNNVLQELKDLKYFDSDAILVELHGLVHTDDRMALKSATTQMNLDNAVDGKVFGTFAENLAFLLACLRTGEKHTSKSIIFIIEEFDLFCNHHNQTLLYNLFDVSQSAQAPICVLGITCRLDVIELLEKRVKSRFSHRQFFLFPGQEDENKSNLDLYLEKIEYYLKLPGSLKISAASKKAWNSNLEDIMNEKKFKNILQRIIDIDLSVHTLKNILIRIVVTLNENRSSLSIEQFQEQLNILEKDETVQVLQDLTCLELCLIIAIKHHMEIYDTQPNFEMILTRYTKFANANSNMQITQRNVVMKAFEHIEKLELISKISGNKTQKEYQPFSLLVTPQQISEAIKKSHGLPTEVVQWANSSFA
ncbi:unnamed protein product [Brassicogethes aeneus]|uniref:Origin recognition complex subunit 4 n=1 Tax=Brassicogethes aeneus TaxID=1431903 RepID=A0A9P0AZ77_BRAAE|nr:unnamed protein product [Brassicogethes aeneus]